MGHHHISRHSHIAVASSAKVLKKRRLQSKTRRQMLSFIILAGFSLALFSHFSAKKPMQITAPPLIQNAVVSPKREQANPGLPVRLKIPQINVDAAVESVGITRQEEMGVPKIPANAAWYNRGPRPGEAGNSVMDGHYGYKDDVPAVFDNLYKLRNGDKLYVGDENGVTNTFVVRETRSYGPGEVVPAVFIANDGKAHLNLITCEGAWNASKKSYSNRLVVFTDEVL